MSATEATPFNDVQETAHIFWWNVSVQIQVTCFTHKENFCRTAFSVSRDSRLLKYLEENTEEFATLFKKVVLFKKCNYETQEFATKIGRFSLCRDLQIFPWQGGFLPCVSICLSQMCVMVLNLCIPLRILNSNRVSHEEYIATDFAQPL